MEKIEILNPEKVWEVVAEDKGFWRAGIYKPEFRSPDEISVLEKHTCPEYFICVGGKAGLVISKDGRESIEYMEQFQAILIESYHNGFIIDENAFFIVAERSSFETEYIERTSGKIIKRVKV